LGRVGTASSRRHLTRRSLLGGLLSRRASQKASPGGRSTAIDALSGRRVWQKRFPEACYSGTSTTKGNLVFLGRSNGELEAYDARNGERLWRFQTGAGANNTASFFEHEGKEYVAFLSQATASMLRPTATSCGCSGSTITLASVLGPGPPPGAGPRVSGEGAAPGRATPRRASRCTRTTARAATPPQGTGGNGGPDISSPLSASQIIAQVTNGDGGMPAFRDQLDQQQINNVAAYVRQEIQGQSP
jgi:hypothetical protein